MLDGALAFLAVFALALIRVPIGIAMALVGFGGLWTVLNLRAAMGSVTLVIYETGLSYTLSVIPLFVLMGNLISQAKMSDELFAAARAFVGHFRGGLALSTIFSASALSAISGSSLATTATMAKVAIPQMRAAGYSDALAAGSVASGGTLGILIPPSVVMVVYGILAQTSIGALFAAGMLPGLISIGLYALAVWVTVLRNPEAGPASPRLSWRERLATIRGIGTFAVGAGLLALAVALAGLDPRIAGALAVIGTLGLSLIYRGVTSVLALFVLVIGGIYGGVFTPTEAASIGAGVALFFTLVRGRMTLPLLLATVTDTVRTTAMLFVILIGALIFANFINYTSLPGDMLAFVNATQASPLTVYLLIVLVYVILGCILESMSMIVLTVPVFLPLVIAMGGDPVWFGIIVVVVTEISLITPPIGMNIFVLKSINREMSLGTIYRGVVPFIAVDILKLLTLILFPAIALFLPRLLGQ